jgi:hypothetical protein
VDGHVRLTEAANGQGGELLLDDLDPGVAVDRLSAHAQVFIGGGNGADGMSFSFGDASGGHPVDGVASGLAVSLDTYDNGGDVFNAVEVRYDIASIAVSGGLTLRTGSYVNLDIVVEASGRITVHHNNVPAIDTTIPGWTAVAGRRFVVRGLTGGLNDEHSIENLIIGTGNAASFATDFAATPVAGANLFGNASYDSGFLRLTPNSAGQTGSVVFDDLDGGAPVQSFTASWRQYIGNGGGADGMSFSFGNLADAAFGENGSGDGLIVRFDTFQQDGGDYAGGIEILYDSATIATTPARVLRTGSFRDLLVVVTDDGRLGVVQNNGTDGSPAVIETTIPGWAPGAGWRFGFGGRTGGITDDHAIDDLFLETIACGNGTVEPGEECDDGNVADGDCCSAACTLDSAGTACTDDANACTDDVCNAGGTCLHNNNTASCDDGVFCNAADTCSAGACTVHAGDPCTSGGECADTCDEDLDTCNLPNGTACTADTNDCTDDICDGSGSCTHPNNTASCDDGLFCNGADTCSGGSCSSHAGDPCSGGGECADTCDDDLDTCNLPGGTACTDDTNGCTDDVCDGSGSCTHPNNTAPCDDGVFCNGADTCSGGSCSSHAGDPCSGGDECADTCDDDLDTCNLPDGTSCTDDGEECTDDFCDGSGACTHPAIAGSCDDGVFCNGADTCHGGFCSQHAGDPCTGGGECSDTCDEDADTCNLPDGTPCTADADICTDDVCDGEGSCSHPANTAPCDDGDACTTGDACAAGTCTGGAPLDCDDGDFCTADGCDSETGCVYTAAPIEEATCIAGEKAGIKIKVGADPARDLLKWKLVKGDALAQEDLGNPDTTATYALCIFDRSGGEASLAGSLTIPPGAAWTSKTPKGWSYKDKEGAADGVTGIKIKTGVDGKSLAALKAKGSDMTWPAPLDANVFFEADPSVLIQLQNSETATCWSTSFATPKRNNASQFSAN